MATTDLLRARTPFVAATVDGRRRINEGDFVSADDPVVKGREKLFETVDEFATRTGKRVLVDQRAARAPKRATAKAKPKPKGK